MDQKLYFVVEINDRGFVFENICQAASFMSDAAEHATKCRYYTCRTADISMYVANYDTLCERYPEDYKKEVDADETTIGADADQSDE